jgi:hypothetical protein
MFDPIPRINIKDGSNKAQYAKYTNDKTPKLRYHNLSFYTLSKSKAVPTPGIAPLYPPVSPLYP